MANLGDLILFHSRVCQARRPEEIFGDLPAPPVDEQLKALSRIYRPLVARYHPDRHRADPTEHYYAHEITVMLNVLHDGAVERIHAGLYGKPDVRGRHQAHGEIHTRQRTYRILEYLAEGDLADVYRAEFDEPDGTVQPVCLKVVRQAADNDLMSNERAVLQLVKHKSLPVWVESFTTTDRTAVTVMRLLDAHDGLTVRERHTTGVAPEHVCWIMERLLSVLGFLHVNGILHGNIEPANLMVRPRDHNAFLIDFTFSLVRPRKGEPFKGANPDYCAPEVLERKPAIPGSDLYALGKCMVFLLGGDVAHARLPDHLDWRLKTFLGRFLEPHPMGRVKDAWECWRELGEVRLKVFGERRQFLPFTV